MDDPMVYCLEEVGGGRRTYVGFTVNLKRRLRQHNGEIVGGAKATTGRRWRVRYAVQGFATRQAALSFEWHWKRRTRRQRGSPIERRRAAAAAMVLLDRWGSGLRLVEQQPCAAAAPASP